MAAVIDDRVALAREPGPKGFDDPVHEAQCVFRAVLEAMSHPGVPASVRSTILPPAAMTATMAAVAVTLLDQDVTCWLSPSLATDAALRDFLTFHTGTRILADPHGAGFVFCASPDEVPPLCDLAQGTPAYPDKSATVIIAAGQFSPAEVVVTLSGPGREFPLPVAVPGVSRDLWRQLRVNHASYPLGVDVLFCTEGAVIGLPRSTTIEVA